MKKNYESPVTETVELVMGEGIICTSDIVTNAISGLESWTILEEGSWD
jgi:hypothetical protein